MNHSSAPFFVCSPMLTHCSIGSFPPPTNVFSGFYLYFILEANWKCKKAYVHIPCKVHRQLKRNHFICDGCVTMAVYTLQQQQCDTMQSYMLLSTNSWIVCICASSQPATDPYICMLHLNFPVQQWHIHKGYACESSLEYYIHCNCV